MVCVLSLSRGRDYLISVVWLLGSPAKHTQLTESINKYKLYSINERRQWDGLRDIEKESWCYVVVIFLFLIIPFSFRIWRGFIFTQSYQYNVEMKF